MNKQEKIIVALLFVSILGWTFLNRQNLTRKVAERAGQAQVASTNQVGEIAEQPLAATPNISPAPVTPAPVPEITQTASKHDSEEEVMSVSDDLLQLDVSSWGGGIVSAELKDYASVGDTNSEFVVLDFQSSPALALQGIPGLGADSDFDVAVNDSSDEVTVSRVTEEKLSFKRVVKLEGSYRVSVVDEFTNLSGAPMNLGQHYVQMGSMYKVKTKAKARRGMAYLDINSLGSVGTDRVLFWETERSPAGQEKLSKRFYEGGGGGCSMFGPGLSKPLPYAIPPVRWEQPTDWVALKNKFFVQTMMPEEGAVGLVMMAKRVVPEKEDIKNSKSWSKTAMLGEVSASLMFDDRIIGVGETMTRKIQYYVGPKKYDLLKKMGHDQDKVMFRAWPFCGWFRIVCVGLLMVLNGVYSVIPNYGVAIIILTLLVKILFWPIMQKSTDSMKKMQSLKPELDILKEKHKSNPQKMQQAQMALYKQHGVNPMASCLPMMIQMPVFIAMFTVIRKAVELRCAGFLWVTDLSEPELLFSGMIPIVGALNILPLLLVITMFLQQKMTPSTGDAQQKQMMMMMPVMMLFFLYNMASGLTLYWTVSQLLSILQLYLQNKKTANAAVGNA
jgi:YidC/Oxa1 family membrane protein insertase